MGVPGSLCAVASDNVDETFEGVPGNSPALGATCRDVESPAAVESDVALFLCVE